MDSFLHRMIDENEDWFCVLPKENGFKQTQILLTTKVTSVEKLDEFWNERMFSSSHAEDLGIAKQNFSAKNCATSFDSQNVKNCSV